MKARASVLIALLAVPFAWPARPAAAASLRWTDCPEQTVSGVPAEERHRHDCATYPVPIDYARPAAGSVDIALLRRTADEPGRRVGSLFVNPGGPGGRGTLLPVELSTGKATDHNLDQTKLSGIGSGPRRASR